MYTESGRSPLPTKVSISTGKEARTKRTSHNKHIQDIDNARVFQGLQNFNFPKSSNRHPLFLVVHQNPFQRDHRAGGFVNCFVHLPVCAKMASTFTVK